MLRNNTTIDGNIIYVGVLVVKAKYICFVQENTNFFWGQQPLQHTIVVPTSTIIHPRLDVVIITDVQDIL